MASRDDIIEFANDYLNLDSYPDYGPMGLQVTGAEEVTKIACGVSASRELFERAGVAGAQLLLVHHGLFWDRDPRVIDGRPQSRRLPPGPRRAPRSREQRAALPRAGDPARRTLRRHRLRRPAREALLDRRLPRASRGTARP
jgi:hypothetical protein